MLSTALGTRMDEPQDGYRKTAVIVVVVVVVFTLNHSVYSTTIAIQPLFVLILHPREIQINIYVTTDCENREKQTK